MKRTRRTRKEMAARARQKNQKAMQLLLYAYLPCHLVVGRSRRVDVESLSYTNSRWVGALGRGSERPKKKRRERKRIREEHWRERCGREEDRASEGAEERFVSEVREARERV